MCDLARTSCSHSWAGCDLNICVAKSRILETIIWEMALSFARSTLKSFHAAKFCLITFFALIMSCALPAHGAPHILVDLNTGRILDQKDALTPWYPASLTKLMTAYVTFEAISAGEVSMRSAVRVSKNALSQPPSKMGFKVGTTLTVENALKMVLVKNIRI